MHPLSPNLSELSDADLQKKHSELTTKLNTAYRMGSYALVSQIQMMLEDYQFELQLRQQKMMQELLAKDNKFKDIIEIK